MDQDPGGQDPGGTGPGGAGGSRAGDRLPDGIARGLQEGRDQIPSDPNSKVEAPYRLNSVCKACCSCLDFRCVDRAIPPPYFAVFNPQGELIRTEPNDARTKWTSLQQSMEYRVVVVTAKLCCGCQGDTLIIVGRDIHHHVDRLSKLACAVDRHGPRNTCFGLVGGWWLSGKTIQPIKQISATADRINAANLSERIETSGMDDEVSALASILNRDVWPFERFISTAIAVHGRCVPRVADTNSCVNVPLRTRS